MREIKARAWFPKAKRMIHFEGISFCDEYDRMCLDIVESDCTEKYQHLAGESYIPNEKGTPTQYTGLKDSEIKDEYFGDIIEEDDSTRRVIEEGASVILFRSIGGKNIKYFWDLLPHKVLGNIWENPELLEV